VALPSNVNFGTVTGRFLRGAAGDAANDLKITFTPSLNPPVARDATSTPPTIFAITPVNATVGSDGVLLGPDGQAGVSLISTTDPDFEPHGWTWGVKFTSPTFPAVSFSFVLDPGQSIDLASVIQVPTNPGTTLTAWLQAVTDARAARDEALDAVASLSAAAPKEPGSSIVLPNGSTVPFDASRPLNPTSTIVVWGHSLADSDGGVMETQLASLLGVPTVNRGVGGNTSTDITIRKGGIIPLVTLTSGQIPADTSSAAATVTPTGPYLVATSGQFTYSGTLAGIPGTLTYTAATTSWAFARTTAGNSTPVPAGTPFLITTPTYNDAVSIFGLVARNNLYSTDNSMATVIRDLDAQIGTLTPYQPRYLVLSDLNASSEVSTADPTSYAGINRAKILASNAARAARYGDNYYDIRADFIANALTMAGMTPTTADLAAIAADAPPPSIMIADGIHPIDAGYQVMARLIANRLAAKGWGNIVTGPQNLLTRNQASIETDTSGWGGNGDGNIAVARSTAQAAVGTASLLVTGGTSAENVIIDAPGVAVTGGQNYGVTAKTRSVTTARVRQIEFYWYDSSHGFLDYGAGSGVTDTTTGWTTVTATQAAPANAAFLRIGIAAGGSAAGEQWYLDAVGVYAIAAGAAVPGFTAPSA
jgi:hypothetical protein